MNVCQECGVNLVLSRGHSVVCSQYTEPLVTESQFNAIHGVDDESAQKLRDFGDAINDTAVERGEKTIESFLRKIGMTEDDPGYTEMKLVMRMSLSVGAATLTHVLIEQGLIDEDALRRAAGV